MITKSSSLNVVNTRPVHQAENLDHLIESMGFNPISFPTLEIKALTPEKIKAACELLPEMDILIFVSANAVQCSHPYWLPFTATTKVLAIGPGTAKTLHSIGIKEVITPNAFSSEGLLELPLLQSLESKKIMIFSGENSRPFLQESLQKRGADVKMCICYKRERPDTNSASQAIRKIKIDALISTSQESLQNLTIMLNDLNMSLKSTPIIVISPMMAKLAESLGWTNVIVAENASDAAISKALTKITNSE